MLPLRGVVVMAILATAPPLLKKKMTPLIAAKIPMTAPTAAKPPIISMFAVKESNQFYFRFII